MKKIVLCIFILSLILVGCGASSNTTDDGKEILEVATWAGGDELEEFQGVVDEVNEASDDYELQVVSIPSDYPVKISTMLSSGDAPDLMWTSQENVIPYAEEGALVDLQAYVDTSGITETYNFNEDIMTPLTYEGNLYGLPWIANPMILYYNKDIVDDEDEALLEATNNGEYLTWDQFYDMAKKYTDIDNGKYGTLINGWPPVEFFIHSFGGQIQDEEGNLTLDTPEVKEAVEFMYKIIVTDPITPTQSQIDSIGYTETFQQGNTALFFGGTSDMVELIGGEEVPFDIGYAVVPGKGTPQTYNYSASLTMSKDAGNKDIAYEALEDLTVAIWDWKEVPPVDVTNLGYSDYEEYLAEKAPEKAGMGKTIEESFKVVYSQYYDANTSTILTDLYDGIYSALLNSAITGEDVDIDTLLSDSITKIEGEMK